MNKEEYVQLHASLAKIKFDLEMDLLNASNIDYVGEVKKQIEAIDEVMKIFIVECE